MGAVGGRKGNEEGDKITIYIYIYKETKEQKRKKASP